MALFEDISSTIHFYIPSSIAPFQLNNIAQIRSNIVLYYRVVTYEKRYKSTMMAFFVCYHRANNNMNTR